MMNTMLALADSTRDMASGQVTKWKSREHNAKELVSAIKSWRAAPCTGNAARVMDVAVRMLQDYPECSNAKHIICYISGEIAYSDHVAANHMRHARVSVSEMEVPDQVTALVEAWAIAPTKTVEIQHSRFVEMP